MTNKELQTYLQQFSDDLPVKLLHTHETKPVGDGTPKQKHSDPIEFTDENVLHTSETAYVDPDAPEDEWDNEDGKIELGGGRQYLLINPVIL